MKMQLAIQIERDRTHMDFDTISYGDEYPDVCVKIFVVKGGETIPSTEVLLGIPDSQV